MENTAPARPVRRVPKSLPAAVRDERATDATKGGRRALSQAHLRLLRVLAFSKDWVDCLTLCARAQISSVEIARVYICEIRSILKSDVEIVTMRAPHRRGLYFLSYLDPDVLPRCPKCNEIL